MKKTCSTILLILFSISLWSQDAKEIVKKADQKMKGEKTSFTVMSMKIVRPTWERTIKFKNWTKGTEFSLALITSPAREKGQSFLKRENDLWSWNPTINRMIKLPPSMMSQGWMGSDFSNDDLLREASIIIDYTHEIAGEKDIDGHSCYKIILTPLEDAAVVWGKLIKWISKDEYLQLKTEYYDEDGYLVKTEIAYDIKIMGGRTIPTKFELIPADEENKKTLIFIDEIEFNTPLSDSFFSQQNMKRVR